MKLKLIIILFVSFFSNFQLSAGSEKKDWFPFVIPEKLYADSPANMGKRVLDAPAGKHGFLKAKGKEFVFEDGTPIKFWGTNLCFEACFPDRQQAVILADRLAFFGFNAVRLHHMDYTFEPKGIFKDISDCKHPQCKKTGLLSEAQLDKLDYFIYQLKQRGIYVDMNLLVSRHFTLADGVIEADKLGMAAKPASMFDPVLIELQKHYAKDLLTHFNPYTQLRYCDDPVIALAEITNENSIVQAWRYNNLNHRLGLIKNNVLPEYYSSALDLLWHEWLKEKYNTFETIDKAWVIENPSSKTIAPIILKESDWELSQYKGTKAFLETKNHEAIIQIKKTTDIPWDLQYNINKITLTKNKNYRITFTAKADKPLKISVVFQQSYRNWKNLGLSEPILLSTDFKTFDLLFNANDNCDNSKLAFLIGKTKAELTFKNINFEEISGIQLPSETSQKQFLFPRPAYKLKGLYPKKMAEDIDEFYNKLEQKYFDQMISYLKNDITLKIPVTGSSSCFETSQTNCHYIDSHTYWAHPIFPDKSWDKNNFTASAKSMLLAPQLGMIEKIIKKQSENKPYTFTEWNHCFPNPYAYEGPLFMAAESSVNHLNGLFQFTFSDGWKSAPQFDFIQSYFDSLANPQQLILLSLGSLIFSGTENISTSFKDYIYKIDSLKIQAAFGFFKGREIKLGSFAIIPEENGAIAVLKTKTGWLITLIGEVKNTDSCWTGSRFNWGKAPVLLKRLPADIEFTPEKKSGSKIIFFELLPGGERGKKLAEYSCNEKISFSARDCSSPWLEVVSS